MSRTNGDYSTVYVAGLLEVDSDDVGVTGSSTFYGFTGQLVVVRSYGPDRTSFLLGNHLNSTVASFEDVTDSLALTRYHPWGTERSQSGSPPSDHGFNGQIADNTAADSGGSGLLYYNARYFDPAVGAFVAADTLIPDAANPVDSNRYAYVRNLPTRYIDKSGHDPSESYLCSGCGVPSTTINFTIPVMRGVGVIEARWVIQAADVPGGMLGDNRPLGPDFDASLSRAAVILDFETGRGSIIITGTCGSNGDCVPPRPTRVTTPDGSEAWNRANEPNPFDDNNVISVTIDDGQFVIDYHLTVSIEPGGPVGVLLDVGQLVFGDGLLPSIDGHIEGTIEDGIVSGTAQIEGFPSLEIYHRRDGRTETLLQFDEGSPYSLRGGPEIRMGF